MSTTNLDKLKDLFNNKSFKEEVEFETQMLALNFLHSIEKEADKQGLNRTELSKKVGKSASYITQLFRANKTPNLRILAALGLALGKQFNVQAVDDIQSHRRYIYDNDNIVGERFDSSKLLKNSISNSKYINGQASCERSSVPNDIAHRAFCCQA